MIERVLIANRGEIAIRIARAARARKIVPLGIASEADGHALHLRAMDEHLVIGPARASESYLDIARVVAAAKQMRADAVHPGYGFLSERADFAQAVIDAGMIFIGPTPYTLRAAGDKRQARQIAQSLHIPTLDGYDGEELSNDELAIKAAQLGYPVLIKATNGGGGRGQRAVHSADEFPRAIEEARREALAAFGDDGVLLERFVERPRHIEFQIVADAHGNVVHFGERDCSLQRRRQKVLEEAPAANLTSNLREAMAEAAIALAQATQYLGAGTVEFLVDEQGRFYFLEINARLQVEHPVTELVHGVDLVDLQFCIADGERFEVVNNKVNGYAIEARICAEDPAHDLLPSCGTISKAMFPAAPGIRVDSGIESGSVVPIDYDSLLAKLCVHAPTREEALGKLADALAQTTISGIATNLPTLRAIVADPLVQSAHVHTTYLDESGLLTPERAARLAAPAFVIAATQSLLALHAQARVSSVNVPLFFTIAEQPYAISAIRIGDLWRCSSLELPGILTRQMLPFELAMHAPMPALDASLRPQLASPLQWRDPNRKPAALLGGRNAITLTAPMPGRVLRIDTAIGTAVDERDVVTVLEAMKMEHRIEAGLTGVVKAIHVKQGDTVAAGAVLLEIAKPE